MALPIPLLLPVTMATLPSKRRISLQGDVKHAVFFDKISR
jgi:hypothetical protein